MKNRNNRNIHLHLNGTAILILAVSIVFFASFKMMPFHVHYGKLEGVHSWLSGSTIKFVNNWIRESPGKLHFLNYENPDSIEFNTQSERGSYISYPSGCTFFVYSFAKLMGKKNITGYFLKHFQLGCFWLEVLLLAIFVYRLLKRIGLQSDKERTIIAFLTATFWSWIPTNVWYLANVYFADQCVILFVMAFLLVEYECYCCQKKARLFALNAIKSLLIFAGVLIDYYFWILAFVAFVLKIVRNVLNKKSLPAILKDASFYIIPVILALAVFLQQLMSVSNGLQRLKSTFLFRTGNSKDGIYNTKQFLYTCLHKNFIDAFGLESVFKVIPILLLVLFLYTQRFKFTKSGKGFFNLIKAHAFGNGGIIIILGFTAPLLQIALLKNHSAIHEFSQIKLGWCFAMLPIIASFFICKMIDFESKRMSQFFFIFIVCFLSLASLMGIPYESKQFYTTRSGEPIDYRLAKVLKKRTSYEHVCFSFSCEIPENPPQQLSLSNKRVYKIKSKEELETLFPNLNANAIKVLVIDKGSENDMTDEQLSEQLAIWQNNETLFEDEDFALVAIKNQN